MTKRQIIFSLCLSIGIMLISEVAVATETRINYLLKMGISQGNIQSIQNLERKVLQDFKTSNSADIASKRSRTKTREYQSHLSQTRTQLRRTASLYNQVLKKHLKPQQIAGYMNHLNTSRELIHIPGGFYSPHILSSFIRF